MLPIELGYASSIHKGQGLTLERVQALHEELFCHGQSYVLISRTRDEENFWAVGVPPQDLMLEVLEAVRAAQQEAIRMLELWSIPHHLLARASVVCAATKNEEGTS